MEKKKHFVKPNKRDIALKQEMDYFSTYFEDVESFNTITEKMIKLACVMSITPEELRERKKICHIIQKILKKFYPNCVVQIFGSSINGYGLKHCDLDLLFLPTPDYCNLDFANCSVDLIPKPSDRMDFVQECLKKMNESDHLQFIRQVLQEKRYLFSRIIFIPARCPILNFIYHKGNVHCDLSASNRLVLSNTELLSFFGRVDERVKPFVKILRLWAKSLSLIRMGNGFSSYSFTMMCIFFLQTLSPPILPSVAQLNSLAGFSQVVAGWETAFTCDIEKIPKCENNCNLEELLHDFFKYYFQFDFTRNVISPFYGKILSIKEIKDASNERMKDFQLRCFHIQDPFILSRNLVGNLSSNMLTELQQTFLVALEMMQSEPQSSYFQNLFDPSTYKITSYELYSEYACIQNGLSHDVTSSVPFDPDVFHSFASMDPVYSEKLWYEFTTKAVFDVLESAFLFNCEVIDMDKSLNWSKCGINETQSSDYKLNKCAVILPGKSVSSLSASFRKLQPLVSIQCIAYYRTWIGRKCIANKVSREENRSSNPVIKEHDISVYLIQKSNLSHVCSSSEPLLTFLCNCYRHSSLLFRDVVIIFTPLSSWSKEFSIMFEFLASNIPKLVNKLLIFEKK